jgi:hypothetical protein
MNQHAAGLLLHPTWFSNAFPIGDPERPANAFVDFVSGSGRIGGRRSPSAQTKMEAIR